MEIRGDKIFIQELKDHAAVLGASVHVVDPGWAGIICSLKMGGIISESDAREIIKIERKERERQTK